MLNPNYRVFCSFQRSLYRDQLLLTERHLDSLLEDTNTALDLLSKLSLGFKSVESQTVAFQSQCNDLVSEQTRVRDLANGVGTSLQYYAYLEPITRRLNAPGAGRLIRNDDFLDMLANLNECIEFMDTHVSGWLSSSPFANFHSPHTATLPLSRVAMVRCWKKPWAWSQQPLPPR